MADKVNLCHMLKAEETKDAALSAIDRYVRMTEDDHLVVALAYQEMIAKIAEIFLPLFQETGGEKGWVAIQGNPYRDDDIDFILQEAHRFYEISPNIVVSYFNFDRCGFPLLFTGIFY